MAESTKKPAAFQTAQPKIPGVPEHKSKNQAQDSRQSVKEELTTASNPADFLRNPYFLAAGGGAILLLVIVLMFWARGSTSRHAANAPVNPTMAKPAGSSATAPPIAPGPVATVAEMKQTWSTKEFRFTEANGSTSPALLVHLPGDAYWAISLREPFGNCELEFANVEKLRSDYNLNAPYPMIGDPCTHAVYDLTRYENGPNGLVRGVVVAGASVRPPLAIEVEVKNDKIVASREEAIAPTQ